MVRVVHNFSTEVVNECNPANLGAEGIRACLSGCGETGVAGDLDGHSIGTHLRHDPDFLGYRGILMTLRSLKSFPVYHTYAFVGLWSLF